jgi:ATP-dependent protease ClpP protease subunit
MAEPIIRLVGDIDEEVVSDVIDNLSRLSHNVSKVNLLIDSDGGSLEEGFRLIDAIRILQSKGIVVKTVATGKIYSMGFFIYCAGNERTAYPSARLMSHCARYEGLDENNVYTASDLKVLFQEMDYYDRLMKGVLMSAGVSSADADQLLTKKDVYFNVPQAMHLRTVQKEEHEIV